MLALVILIGVPVALAVARHPPIGAGLITFCVITRLPEIAEHRLGIPTLTVPLALGIGVLAGSVGIRERTPPSLLPVAVALLATRFVVLLLGLPGAESEDRVIAELAGLLRDGLVFLGVVAAVCTPAALRSAAYGVILGGLVVGGAAAAQYTSANYDQTYLGLAKAPIVGVVDDVQGYRAAGPLGDPNFFAQTMVVVAAVALERALRERRVGAKNLARAALILSILAIFLSLSRGGLIALAVTIAIGIARYRSVLTLALAAGVLVPLTLAIAPAGFTDRVANLSELSGGSDAVADNALRGRVSEMRSAVDMFVDHPVTGLGAGGFPVAYPEYASRLGLEDSATDRNAHSLLLQQAAETGAVGLLQLAALLGVAWTSARRRGRRCDPPGQIADGVALALIGYLAAGLFLHLSYPDIFWMIVGLALACGQVAPRSVVTPDRPTPIEGRLASPPTTHPVFG